MTWRTYLSVALFQIRETIRDWWNARKPVRGLNGEKLRRPR